MRNLKYAVLAAAVLLTLPQPVLAEPAIFPGTDIIAAVVVTCAAVAAFVGPAVGAVFLLKSLGVGRLGLAVGALAGAAIAPAFILYKTRGKLLKSEQKGSFTIQQYSYTGHGWSMKVLFKNQPVTPFISKTQFIDFAPDSDYHAFLWQGPYTGYWKIENPRPSDVTDYLYWERDGQLRWEKLGPLGDAKTKWSADGKVFDKGQGRLYDLTTISGQWNNWGRSSKTQ